MIRAWDQLPKLSFREKIAYLAYKFLQLEQTECPLDHEFTEGTYTRTMKIPADTLFIGREHLLGHQCDLVEGELIHVTPEGKKLHVKAPFTIHTPPGYHTVFYTISPCVGRTVHPNQTNSKDIEALEASIFEPAAQLALLGEYVDKRLILK